MVPNLCIDKKLGFDSPRCAVSFPKIGIGQMDSKQEFFAPSDVQVNLQCAIAVLKITLWLWLCACMSEGSPLWGAGNVRPKHQLVEQNFTQNYIQNFCKTGLQAIEANIEAHASSTSRPLGILGRCHPRPPATSAHHRGDPPPTTSEPNRTSPPSRQYWRCVSPIFETSGGSVL